MSPVEEPHYFNRDLNHMNIPRKDEYLNLFEGANEAHQAIGEASTHYLFSEVAVPEERVHVIVFDDLEENASREFQEALQFLDLDEHNRTDFRRIIPPRSARLNGYDASRRGSLPSNNR